MVAETIVGWVDYDPEASDLEDGAVNIGYNVFAEYRLKGYATRAVALLLRRIAQERRYRTGVLRIDPGNGASLAVAAKAGFLPAGEVHGQLVFERPVSANSRR